MAVLKRDNNRIPLTGSAGVTPDITNTTLTNANTEYLVTLRVDTYKLGFQNRNNNAMRFAFVTGKVATPTAPYFTLKAGDFYYEDNILLSGATIYFASANAGDIVEMVTWA